jgi:flagellar biosynthesis/type III secretory pathway protein FliH
MRKLKLKYNFQQVNESYYLDSFDNIEFELYTTEKIIAIIKPENNEDLNNQIIEILNKENDMENKIIKSFENDYPIDEIKDFSDYGYSLYRETMRTGYRSGYIAGTKEKEKLNQELKKDLVEALTDIKEMFLNNNSGSSSQKMVMIAEKALKKYNN